MAAIDVPAHQQEAVQRSRRLCRHVWSGHARNGLQMLQVEAPEHSLFALRLCCGGRKVLEHLGLLEQEGHPLAPPVRLHIRGLWEVVRGRLRATREAHSHNGTGWGRMLAGSEHGQPRLSGKIFCSVAPTSPDSLVVFCCARICSSCTFFTRACSLSRAFSCCATAFASAEAAATSSSCRSVQYISGEQPAHRMRQRSNAAPHGLLA